jgi:hypothetical protein
VSHPETGRSGPVCARAHELAAFSAPPADSDQTPTAHARLTAALQQIQLYYTYFVYIVAMPKMPRNLKNITITLDKETAAWVRLSAGEHGMSVSRLVGDVLNERMREARNYNEAMRHFLSQKPRKFAWVDAHPPPREEIHDRHAARQDRTREAAT